MPSPGAQEILEHARAIELGEAWLSQMRRDGREARRDESTADMRCRPSSRSHCRLRRPIRWCVGPIQSRNEITGGGRTTPSWRPSPTIAADTPNRSSSSRRPWPTRPGEAILSNTGSVEPILRAATRRPPSAFMAAPAFDAPDVAPFLKAKADSSAWSRAIAPSAAAYRLR